MVVNLALDWMLTNQGLCIQRPCIGETPVHVAHCAAATFPNVLYLVYLHRTTGVMCNVGITA